jgi:hypothetical protein
MDERDEPVRHYLISEGDVCPACKQAVNPLACPASARRLARTA